MNAQTEALGTVGLPRRSAAKAVLAGGLVAGLLDILFAFVVNGLKGTSPEIVLQAIASGIFGRPAFAGGAGMAAIGAVLHFGITIAMAAIFLFAWRSIPLVRARPIAAGLAYGVAIFLGMSYVVLPLSNFPGAAPVNIGQIFAMIVLVGLPIALAVRRFAPA